MISATEAPVLVFTVDVIWNTVGYFSTEYSSETRTEPIIVIRPRSFLIISTIMRFSARFGIHRNLGERTLFDPLIQAEPEQRKAVSRLYLQDGIERGSSLAGDESCRVYLIPVYPCLDFPECWQNRRNRVRGNYWQRENPGRTGGLFPLS